jgi:hypothetical protein
MKVFPKRKEMMLVPLVRRSALVIVCIERINAGYDHGNSKIWPTGYRVYDYTHLKHLPTIWNIPHLRPLGAFASCKMWLRTVEAAGG